MKKDFSKNFYDLQGRRGGRGSSLPGSALNFLLNFGIAVVWLGRWTIKWTAKLWQRWSR